MPHIIIEYEENLFSEQEVNSVLKTIHLAVADSDLFDVEHIKTRAYSFRYFTHGNNNEPYLHVQARIKEGRNSKQKQHLSSLILQRLNDLKIIATIITVEVIDMDQDSYAKLKS